MKKYLVLILCLIFISISGCSAAKTFTLSGTIEYTQYDVHAEAAGKISAVNYSEGDAVKEGDILAAIDSSVQETAVQQAQAAADVKSTRLEELKSGSRKEQIDQAKASLKAAQAKYDDVRKGATDEQTDEAKAAARAAAAGEKTAKTAYYYYKNKYEDALTAYNSGLIPKDKLDDAKYAMDNSNSQYTAAKEQHNLSLAKLDEVKAGATTNSVKAAKAGVDQAKASLDLLQNGSTDFVIAEAQSDLDAANAQLSQAKILRERCNIKAPVSGTLSILNIDKGGMLSSGGYAATLIDPNDVWAYLYVPQSKLKYVSLNQMLDVTTSAWPGKTFKSSVTYVSSEAEFTPKNTQTDESKENTVFKIKIKLSDDEHLLKAGMSLDAVIPIQ